MPVHGFLRTRSSTSEASGGSLASPLGGRHAELMEIRRMTRSFSLGGNGSATPGSASGKKTPSEAGKDFVAEELAKVNDKLDSLSGQIAKCLEDVTHLRLMGQCGGNNGTASSHLEQTEPERGQPCPRPCPFTPPPAVVFQPRVSVHSSQDEILSEGSFFPHRLDNVDGGTEAEEETGSGNGRRNSGSSGSSDLMREVYHALRRVRHRGDVSRTLWAFLEDPATVPGGRTFMRMMSVAIVFSAFIPVVQTMNPPPFDVDSISVVEIGLDFVFAVEVIARFYSCPNRLVFCLSAYNVIDMAAGLLVLGLRSVSTSSLLQADSDGSYLLLSLICAIPVLRLLKLLRRFETFHLILKAFRLASEALPVLLFILTILVLVFASLIYVFEPRDNIDTLPSAIWMTIVTVGTVGYGDIVPTSAVGTCIVSVLIVVSALYMAIPIGIVGKAFSAVWDDRDRLLLMYRTRSRFLERGYKAHDVPTMFCSFDTNGDGQLDLQEFLAMMHSLQIELGGDRLVDLFSTFDNDDSGAIDDQEFVRTLFPNAYAEIYGNIKEQGEGREPIGGLPQAEEPRQASKDPPSKEMPDAATEEEGNLTDSQAEPDICEI